MNPVRDFEGSTRLLNRSPLHNRRNLRRNSTAALLRILPSSRLPRCPNRVPTEGIDAQSVAAAYRYGVAR